MIDSPPFLEVAMRAQTVTVITHPQRNWHKRNKSQALTQIRMPPLLHEKGINLQLIKVGIQLIVHLLRLPAPSLDVVVTTVLRQKVVNVDIDTTPGRLEGGVVAVIVLGSATDHLTDIEDVALLGETITVEVDKINV